MKRMKSLLVSLIVATLIAGPALAQDFIIYPAKGQSNQQMEKDKFECYSWAKGQSGFDPMETPRATAPPPPKQAQSTTAGGAAKGAVGGGLLGLGIGAIAGNAGKGAAIGAVSGAAIGGVRSHRQQKQDEQAQQQWAQQQANQYQQKRSAYNRAYSACLEGKGYTVK
jgi:hypothetical protein